jgi:hypothetical protein
MEILFFLVVFSTLLGLWANSYGRNGWVWGICGVFFSPILVAIALLIAGKTIEKKAQEAAAIAAIINK